VAKIALDSGMPALCRMICEDILQNADAHAAEKQEARSLLVDALISQGEFENALARISEDVSLGRSNENNLKIALANIGLNDPKSAHEHISKVNADKLPQNLLSWYYLGWGYIFYAEGKFESANKNFAQARATARTKLALADSEMALNLLKLSADLKDGELAELEKSLKEKSMIYMGTPAGFNFAKQYAIVLDRLGKNDEALKVIDEQLSTGLASAQDIEDLKLISSIVTADIPERARQTLMEILLTTRSPSVMEYALRLLKNAYGSDAQGFESALKDILKNGSELVRDRVLLELSYACMQHKDKAAAAKYAGDLLENYPGSQLKREALRILTWVAIEPAENKQPEYRLAANYLLSIATLEPSAEGAARAKMLAADCYFLEKDYESAGLIYEGLIDSGAPIEDLGSLLNRAVACALIAGDYKKALTLADRAYKNQNLSADDIWRAEWALANYFKSAGKSADAMARISKVLASENASRMDAALKLRMLWLQARIPEESGDHKKTAELCDALLKELSALKPADAAKPDFAELAANTRLLKARNLSIMGLTDSVGGSFENYEKLRAEYPATEAAQLSWLYQARDLAAIGRYDAAVQLCKTLADTYPKGPYAATALFEAAQYSRQMGLDVNYKNALVLLDTMSKNYPEDPKVFYARLMQGDILRILNAFAEARSIYEDIIAKWARHPEVYLAWMGLGDSLLAQQDKEAEASAIFERLYSLTDSPFDVKAEAAFKWGFALSRVKRTREAAEVWWLTSRGLLASDASLDDKGRYWIGRSLLELAKTLEDLGQTEDARAAYKLVDDHNLAGAASARKKLNK